jgi:regulator of sigma E protease
MSILIAILGLGFLVLIHEAGHFYTARAVGMRPRRFYVGFPPALLKTTRNGIEYGLGAIPLGGYVKIPGMHRPAPSDADMYLGRATAEAPELISPLNRLKRVLEAGDLARARDQLEDVSGAVEQAGLAPQTRATAERGLRELADGLGDDAYWRQRTWRRVVVIFAGPGANLLLAVLLFAALYMVGGGKATTTVDQVIPGRPAAAAGLHAGDRIVAIGGKRVGPADIPERIAGSNGRPLTLTVARDGRTVVIGPVRPQRDNGVYRIGFVLRGEGLSPPQAVWSSVKLTGLVTAEIGKSLGRLVQGQDRKDVSSPVGIVQSSSAAARAGIQNYLWVLGLLSLSLALLNLLPLLPLDGGHIAFSLIEGVRGRAVGRAVYERVSAVGIALVLLLFFIGLSNDINRLGGG